MAKKRKKKHRIGAELAERLKTRFKTKVKKSKKTYTRKNKHKAPVEGVSFYREFS